MKSQIAISVVVIVLLVGSTRLPPNFVPEFSDSVKAACSPLLPGQRATNERLAATMLKTLASAEADFRANDRDWDGVNQFWRRDVAGLYAMSPPGGMPIRLIDLDVAAADDCPLPNFSHLIPSRTLSGYRFRAIRHADEDPKRLDPQRFAFCAYPARPGAGKYMFVIDENNDIRRCPAEDYNGIDIFPTDAELKMKWCRA